MLTQPYAASAKSKTYSVPTGTILPFMGEDIPDGFLLCNGAWVSVEEYPDLFGVIGTWCEVSADGSEFQLPDTRDRFLMGAGTNSPGVGLAPGLPQIQGQFMIGGNATDMIGFQAWGLSGAISRSYNTEFHYGYISTYSESDYAHNIAIKASDASSVYSNSVASVQPPAFCVRYIVRA